MKHLKSVIGELVLLISIFIGASPYACAENLAEGSLTVDGERTAIKHVYADVFDGDITIVLTSKPIPQEMVPDGVYNLGKQGKFRGIVFAVSGETHALLTGGIEKLINAIHFPPTWNKLGSVGNGALTISKFNDDMLTGKIATQSDNELAGHTFSYEISFSVSLKKEPLELSITGNTDPPALAFAAWAKALLAGDLEGYKQHASQEVIELLPKDEKELAFGIEMQQSMFPIVIKIVSSTIEGNKAVLAMTGRRGGDMTEGVATMLLEDGQWKVNKQSWKSSTTRQ